MFFVFLKKKQIFEREKKEGREKMKGREKGQESSKRNESRLFFLFVHVNCTTTPPLFFLFFVFFLFCSCEIYVVFVFVYLVDEIYVGRPCSFPLFLAPFGAVLWCAKKKKKNKQQNKKEKTTTPKVLGCDFVDTKSFIILNFLFFFQDPMKKASIKPFIIKSKKKKAQNS